MTERLHARRRPGQPVSGSGSAVPGAGAARSERFILLGVVLTRMLGLTELTADVCIGWYRHGFTPPVAVLAGAVLAESVTLLAVSWARGSVSARWAGADAVFMALGLIAFASQTDRPFDPWTFMFQFSFTSAVTIGSTFRRLRAVMLWQCVPAAAYAATALAERNAGWNVPQDLVSYFGSAVVIWALAAELRRSGRALDEARADAVTRESALAAERVRSRYVRDLHDRVLQTLETLARGRLVSDGRVLAQVSRDAFWLRRLVEGAPVPATAVAGDLSAALAIVIDEHITAGLRVDLHASRVRGNLTVPAAQALAAATGEALTNVRQHAGVTHAVVRAASEDAGIKVSVLDSGCGFDAAASHGFGLRESIGGRLQQVGGYLRIDSAAGSGTCIEMWVPATQDDGGEPG